MPSTHRGGEPALLFLSGGFGTVRDWDRVIQRLAGRYRTVRFDTRARGKCATVYIVGTGGHSGATEEEMRTVRSYAAKAEASNKRVSVFATVPYNHVQILDKAPDTVVRAIEDVIRQSS